MKSFRLASPPSACRLKQAPGTTIHVPGFFISKIFLTKTCLPKNRPKGSLRYFFSIGWDNNGPGMRRNLPEFHVTPSLRHKQKTVLK